MKKEITSNKIKLQTKAGENFAIPINGSLGLLALGDIGLFLWRKRKNEFLAKIQSENTEQNNPSQ